MILLLQIKPIKSSLSHSIATRLLWYNCGTVFNLLKVGRGGDTTIALAIWSAYYALAKHLNESTTWQGHSFEPTPHNTQRQMHTHGPINMLGHGFIDPNAHTQRAKTCMKTKVTRTQTETAYFTCLHALTPTAKHSDKSGQRLKSKTCADTQWPKSHTEF